MGINNLNDFSYSFGSSNRKWWMKSHSNAFKLYNAAQRSTHMRWHEMAMENEFVRYLPRTDIRHYVPTVCNINYNHSGCKGQLHLIDKFTNTYINWNELQRRHHRRNLKIKCEMINDKCGRAVLSLLIFVCTVDGRQTATTIIINAVFRSSVHSDTMADYYYYDDYYGRYKMTNFCCNFWQKFKTKIVCAYITFVVCWFVHIIPQNGSKENKDSINNSNKKY